MLKRRGARFVFDQHDLVPGAVPVPVRPRRGLPLPRGLPARAGHLPRRGRRDRDQRELPARWRSPAAACRRTRCSWSAARPRSSGSGRCRRSRSCKKGKPHLLCYLGVMGPQDGVDYALRSLAALRDEQGRDDWHAVFVGAGDTFDDMVALADDARPRRQVEFTGRIPDEDLVRYLSTADVCLSPDPKNPLNDVSTMNKVMEYMAMGKPIVSFELREARVSAGDAAVYAPANDESGVREAHRPAARRPGRTGHGWVSSAAPAWPASSRGPGLDEVAARGVRVSSRQPSVRALCPDLTKSHRPAVTKAGCLATGFVSTGPLSPPDRGRSYLERGTPAVNDDTARLSIVGHVFRQRWRLLIAFAVVGAARRGRVPRSMLSPGYEASASVLLQGPREPDELTDRGAGGDELGRARPGRRRAEVGRVGNRPGRLGHRRGRRGQHHPGHRRRRTPRSAPSSSRTGWPTSSSRSPSS